MKLEVKIINAFSIDGTGGNPAAVVLNADHYTKKEKQDIAAIIGLPETAFVSKSKIADFKLDFFTPVKQIAHCGHATVATFSYLKQKGLIQGFCTSKETIDGTRRIFLENNEAYMEQQAPRKYSVDPDLDIIIESLHLNPNDLGKAKPEIVNTGNSFLLIEVKNELILKNISPDLDKIKAISEKYQLIGYYVYALAGGMEKEKQKEKQKEKEKEGEQGYDATTRMFGPYYGINEEAGTGMAAGALATQLYDKSKNNDHFLIEQGKYMEHPSRSMIKVRLNLDSDKNIVKLYAGGAAYVAQTKMIELPENHKPFYFSFQLPLL